MEYELLFLGLPGMQALLYGDYRTVLTKPQSVVCIIAIMACKSMGLIKDLAKFDNEKAKKCMFGFHDPFSAHTNC